MKLLLLKILLQRRARDEGFTLPMVIALGLVMLLLGTVNIVKSNEENITSISQNSSSDALAIAEAGVTKYRELLNQNRILTVYNDDQWTSTDSGVNHINVAGQACHNMTTTTTPTGWKDGGTATAPNSTAKWWNLAENIDGTTGDETIGAYRLVSYIYDNDRDPATNNNGDYSVISDANENDDSDALAALAGITKNSITNENDTNDDGKSDARGILTVQGRSPDGSSVAQIEVEIPLRINDLENFAPVLWVGNDEITNTGTLNIPNNDDNVVLKSSGSGCPTPSSLPGTSDVTNNLISDPRSLSAVDSAPTNSAQKNTISIDTTSSKLLLPRPTATPDNKDSKGIFPYEVTTITVVNNDLVTDGIAKVALYATDNINITGTSGATRTIGNTNAANPSASASCTGFASYANFNCSNTISTSISSQNLEIYLAGTKEININPNGGIVNIEAFIHAPGSTLNITGSGTVNINGAVWVNNFNNSGTATVNIKSDKTDTLTGSESAYKFYKTTATMSPRPLTSAPTNWVREELQ